MEDRELLGLAAIAAGLWIKCEVEDHQDNFLALRVKPSKESGRETTIDWNPLADDGDALRLAVKLRFGITDIAPSEDSPNAQAWGMVEIWREGDSDPINVEWYKAGACRYAVTRLAIVRAAAKI